MAHISDDSNKRAVSVEINIVPFIDLMSVLVIFLLITAVWTQVSMIQIGSSVYSQKTTEDMMPLPPKAEIAFRLDVKANGYRVLIGTNLITIPKNSGEYDQDALLEELKKVKATHPDKEDSIISVADELPYLALIGGMDALLASGFPQIAIATGEVE